MCFVAAGLLELQLEGCLALEGKKAKVTGSLPENRQYLRPLYDFIAEKSPVKIEKIVEAYRIAFTDRRMNELLAAVGGSLAALGMVEEGKRDSLVRRQPYVPTREAVRSVVEELRSELLEEGPVTEDAAALTVLLDKGKCLKPYFSQFEQKEMRQKLKSLGGFSGRTDGESHGGAYRDPHSRFGSFYRGCHLHVRGACHVQTEKLGSDREGGICEHRGAGAAYRCALQHSEILHGGRDASL